MTLSQKTKKNDTGKFYFQFHIKQIYPIPAHNVTPNSERTEKLK